MAPDRLTGGCGCGAVRFEVAAPLGPARYCHCTDCQRRTGTAAGVRPTARQFVAYAAPWEPIPDDGLARHDERMPRV
jgi:hypothetical protein